MKPFFQFPVFLLLSVGLIAPLVTGARAREAQSSLMNSDPSNSAQKVGVGSEKRARTPAQQKIDSQLLYAIYRERGEAQAKGVPTGELRIKFDEKGRAFVSIRARVTRRLLAKVKSLGGEVISSSVALNDVRAHVPLARLEELAALKTVRAIMPAEEAMTNK